MTFEERIGDGALVIANGFPVSWDVSSVWNSSDVQCVVSINTADLYSLLAYE